MNVEDIQILQGRINEIWSANATPEIIIATKPSVQLRDISRNLLLNRCTLISLYNEFRERRTEEGSVTLPMIAASLVNSPSEIPTVVKIIESDPYLRSLVGSNVTSSIRQYVGRDITILGVPRISIHEFISNATRIAGRDSLQAVYNSLKNMISMTGKVLSMQAILGGVAYAFSNLPLADVYNMVVGFEDSDFPVEFSVNRFSDIATWYREQTEVRPTNLAFYRDSLQKLLRIEETESFRTSPVRDIKLYEPQVELDRVIIRPIKPLNVIDMINNARTSPDVPLIIANMNGRTITKVYDKVRKQLAWIANVDPDTMRIIVRISRSPERYDTIIYNIERNFFVISRSGKQLSIHEMSNLLCSHLNLDSLTLPRTSTSTYSFVTNYIQGPRGEFGIDRHVIAQLITNPPAPYRDSGIGNYVFIKEDTRPNALRKHVTIHIQLGTEKMYISFSDHMTTSGTLVPVSTVGDRTELTGFFKGQRYMQVRINKCPNIAYAHICQSLYRHILHMYFANYDRVSAGMLALGVSLPLLSPKVTELRERVPTVIEEYAYRDPVLYSHVSGIEPSILAVPIRREDVERYQREMYSVMRLPTVIVNNPLIRINTNGEIWVRTARPSERFMLTKKNDGSYIPVTRTGRIDTNLLVTVNQDWTLTQAEDSSTGNTYILGENVSPTDKVWRLAYLSSAVQRMLLPIVGEDRLPSLYRQIISRNIIYTFNRILMMNISPEQVAQYAYLCMQECWDQPIQEVAADIRSLLIHPMRHFRALEKAFNINIYFIMDDVVEPYLRRPPHAQFYLHRQGNPNNPVVLLHSLHNHPDEFTVLLLQTTDRSSRRIYNYKFTGVNYFDQLMQQTNVVRMVSPADGIVTRVTTAPIRMELGNWRASEQVIDVYGKTRAITYSRRDANGQNLYTTINIGFAPIQELPIGEIRSPAMIRVNGRSTSLMIQDLQSLIRQGQEDLVTSLSNLILNPLVQSVFASWVRDEKVARILRIITHLLYSQMDVDADEFIEDYVQVSEEITQVDVSRVTSTLPPIRGDPYVAWNYFASILPDIVVSNEDERFILVPTEETREALRLHILATPKIRWPNTFPQLVLYKWDVDAGSDESVYLDERDLVQQIIVERAPIESSSIILSPIPYVLTRGLGKYLIQMARNKDHARYIANRWDTASINPGYEATYVIGVEGNYQQIPADFTEIINTVSLLEYNGSIFVVMPLI